jgi:hypothetical protein
MTMEENRFRFDLPDGWEDQTVYHFRGPFEGEREHLLTLTLSRQVQHDDVASFAKEQTDPIVESMQGIDVIKDEEVTIENGNQAYEFVYRWMPAEGVTVFRKQVFVIKDRIGFMFSCEFSKKTLKTVGVGMRDAIEALVPGTYEPLEED